MDRSKNLKLYVIDAHVVSHCPECGEPATGRFNDDEWTLRISCVGCPWRDELLPEIFDWHIREKTESATEAFQPGEEK